MNTAKKTAAKVRPRVMHFVSGGFSGATQVALDLVRCEVARGDSDALLVLRRKRHTDLDLVARLRREGVPIELVPGWSHFATIGSLAALCRRWRPQVLIAHGFPEHLDGRWAGLLAGVPALVAVEHNSRERYSRFRLMQARWLARHSARLVACGEGVRDSLIARGFPAERCTVIANGIRLDRFAAADSHHFDDRIAGVVMPARFARQKDQPTLLRALRILRNGGLQPPTLLAGGGRPSHMARAKDLSRSLGLSDQVRFLGHDPDVPTLLMKHRICVLATHWEGLPLSLVEGMAAGCAVVASDVAGVRELIAHGVTGLLVAPGDPVALAAALASLLRDPALAQRLGAAARLDAIQRRGRAEMVLRYDELVAALTESGSATGAAV
jgi:glycosyltransferase involved in cell wall biosynthesis